jgi:Uma2 family endonuclease
MTVRAYTWHWLKDRTMTTHAPVDIDTTYYPESDGKPMGETDAHIQAIIETIGVLTEYFRLQPNVLVGGNMMMYHVKGNPRRSFSPDTFVVFGVPKYSRRVYKVWEEGVPSTVVFEFPSRSTKDDDTDEKEKPALYASLGVEEYFLFDPLSEYLVPPLQGFRLVAGRYQPLRSDEDGRLRSEALGLLLQPEGPRLRFIEANSGTPLLWRDEVAESNRVAIERARKAEARERAEAEARQAAEDEIARLRAELARLRGDTAS